MNIAPLHNWTPTLESKPLSKLLNKKVWLKMECYQPTGSFKIRGLGRLCQYWISQGKNQLVCSSGGNAGLAVAYAGQKLGAKVKVFIPSNSKSIFIDAIKAYDAEVVIAGEVWDEANEKALAYSEKVDAGFVPPFEHPLIWQGHSTLIDEIEAENIKPDAIIAAVGGGGLACGILEGLHHYGWNDLPFYAVETEGAASFAKSIAANHIITLPKINTIATSLGAKRITERLWQWYQTHPVSALVVTDHQAARACESFVNDHRAFVEPSSGAALSVLYDKNPAFAKYDSLLVVVCGGVGISLKLLQEYLQ